LIKKSSTKQIFAYSSIGLQLAGTLLIFVYAGYKLDSHFKTTPWLLVCGTVLGMCIGFFSLFKELSGIDKGKQKEEESRRKWL
jgi:F0F1-type ATP synthase assembly protein I